VKSTPQHTVAGATFHRPYPARSDRDCQGRGV